MAIYKAWRRLIRDHRRQIHLVAGSRILTRDVRITSQGIDKIDRFSYLGSVTDVQGGPDADVKARIPKSRQAFTSLEPICSSQKTFLTTKVELYKSNVKTVLHYGSETWKSTQEIITKLRVFTYKCVRIILGIR